MNITIEELLRGKSTVIKGKEFFPTKQYVEPFLEKMSKFTNDFDVSVVLPSQMTLSKESTDTTYNRVLIQAIMPEDQCIDNHDETIGLLYGIDVRKPIVSLYRGYLNRACTNLTVFNPIWIRTNELAPETPINFTPLKELMELTSDFKIKLETMKSVTLDRDSKETHVGTWIDNVLRQDIDTGFGKVKISTAHVISAYKKLFLDQESEYFVPQGVDPTLFNVYEAFTQIITDDKKDIMSKPYKTLLLSNILNLPFKNN